MVTGVPARWGGRTRQEPLLELATTVAAAVVGAVIGPLADHRGARGRAVAIRDAILTALRSGSDVEEALQQAIAAGIPPHQQRLFLPAAR
jgi:hypothetical protein